MGNLGLGGVEYKYTMVASEQLCYFYFLFLDNEITHSHEKSKHSRENVTFIVPV